jgi:hypothetical protein
MIGLFLLGCVSLAGDWSGEVVCDGFAMDVEIALEPDGGDYVGEGTLDCTAYWGSPCSQSFTVEVEAERDGDEWELDADSDDCEVTVDGQTSPYACDDPTDLVWDGKDEIEGKWVGCDVEMERD